MNGIVKASRKKVGEKKGTEERLENTAHAHRTHIKSSVARYRLTLHTGSFLQVTYKRRHVG